MTVVAPPTLDGVTEFIVDCLHATAPTEDDGFPLIRTPNIGKGRLDLDGVQRVSLATYETWTQRAVPEAGDLIFAREAPAGNVAVVLEGQQVCLGQRTVHIRPNREKVDPSFLCYYLLAPQQQGLLMAAETGATAKHINMKDIRRLPLTRLPALSIQKRIGGMLADYDDLIDNNRRRIKLLEDSVRLLFDEWFVRLRFPGHERSTFRGGIPDGWARSSLGQVVGSLEDGDWIESKDQGGDDFRILQISNIGLNDFRETGNLRFISDETFRRLRCREVTPGMILIARMPTPIGRAMMITEMPWRMVTAVDVAILEPDDEVLDRHVLLYHLNSAENLARCEGRTVGATRPRVTRRELAELPLLVPGKRTQAAFSDIAADVQAQRHVLSRQNEKLRTARDLLLPRLMSGELAV